MKILKNKKFLSVFIGVIYFILLFLGMRDYNIFWDARNHYFKGQDFANFFLYGRHNYNDLPITQDFARYYRDYLSRNYKDPNIQKRTSKDPNYRRSIYQDDYHNFDWLMKSDQIEHPVFSDIMSSFSNIIFYEKLGVLRDDYAYRVYTLFLSSVLVAVVFYWSITLYGFLPAMVAAFVLGTTPLFWAESHFNLKDVPQMTFFSLAIWQFWQGITAKKKKNIIFSAFFAAFAFSTKLNIVFMPFILSPWLLVFYLSQDKKGRRFYNRWWWLLFIYPFIMFTFFIAIWPQMWSNPFSNFMKVIEIYREVGVAPDYTPAFRTVFNFSTYASIWIFLTTYPWVILLSAVGIFFSIKNLKKTKDYLPLLFLLWFVVPVIRGSLPFTSIFGGVRHIIEYVPALSLLAGFGVYNSLKLFKNQKHRAIAGSILIIGFIPLIFTLIKLHPAENVYFNSFIGGLSGAKKANITGWGYNDGGIYREAVNWLNQHASRDSHVAVAFSEPADFYIPELRYDLIADNATSGFLQKGEYIIGLTHDNGLEGTYNLSYPETFLEPVYQFVVDGVPLIKIWENDKTHMKKEFSQLKFSDIDIMPIRNGNDLIWKLDSKKRIMGLEISFTPDNSCKKMDNGLIRVSSNGQNWELLQLAYPGGPLNYLGDQPKNNKLIAPIPGSDVSFIMFSVDPSDSCLFNVSDSKITVLE